MRKKNIYKTVCKFIYGILVTNALVINLLQINLRNKCNFINA